MLAADNFVSQRLKLSMANISRIIESDYLAIMMLSLACYLS